MSYDYGKDKNKKKPAKKNQKAGNKPAVPGWAMFLSGVAFTVFAQFLFHLTQVDTTVQTTDTNTAQATAEEPAHKKPTINFYNQLKDMEVKVPGDEHENPAAAIPAPADEESATAAITDTKAAETSNTTPVSQHYLQAGSFKTHEDADQRRAELLLLGVKANIEVKNNADGSTFHRVIIGPFNSATELGKARNTLLENNIPTLTIKR